jgi:hypothetical protein
MLIARLLGSARMEHLTNLPGQLLMLPILSITIAGSIYLLFAIAMAWIIGKLTLKGVMIQAILSPVYFAAVVFLSFSLWGVVIGDPGGMKVGGLGAFYAVALGYVYVAIVLTGYFVYNRLATHES